MKNLGIINHCCDEHSQAYIRARERARIAGIVWTPEETRCLDKITSHLAELRADAK